MLEEASNIQELQYAVRSFPKDLEELYNKILNKITQSTGSLKAVRTLNWIAFAKRPLKGHELQTGLLVHGEYTIIYAKTKALVFLHDICRPLVDDGPNGTVVFSHSSIKE